jgi:hypothetical protein
MSFRSSNITATSDPSDPRRNDGHSGMDLLGRKMTMKKGKAGELYLAEVRKTIREASRTPD